MDTTPQKPPALTSASTVPSEPKLPEAYVPKYGQRGHDLLRDESIIAMPLGSPATDRVRYLNPNIMGRWVNRRHSDARRVAECESQGFRIATPADAVIDGLSPKDNKWIDGDLVLMVCDKTKYLGALKYNEQKARHAANPRAFLEEFNRRQAEAGGLQSDRKKIEVFTVGDEAEYAKATRQKAED